MKYDAITIRRLPSGNYQYRLRDPDAGKYQSMTFARVLITEDGKPGPDAKRDKPGTAAGDAWAKKQLARFRLGQATAEAAEMSAVVDSYLVDLRGRTRRGKSLNETHVRDVERTLMSLALSCHGVDLNRPHEAATSIKTWFRGLKATSTTTTGKVLRKKLDLAPRTKARYWVHVRSLMRWAVDEGLILRNPVARVKVDADGDTEPETFGIHEVRAIMSLDDRDSPAWLWVALMLWAGLRSAEAKAIRWQDVNWEERTLTVIRGKGGRSRLVEMQPGLFDLLADLGGPTAPMTRVGPIVGLFVGDNRKGEWNAFRAVLKRAEVASDRGTGEASGRPRRLHPHSCRHTHAALSLAAGADSLRLQHNLGHLSEDMTKHYSRMMPMYSAKIVAEGWERGRLYLDGPRSSTRSQEGLP